MKWTSDDGSFFPFGMALLYAKGDIKATIIQFTKIHLPSSYSVYSAYKHSTSILQHCIIYLLTTHVPGSILSYLKLANWLRSASSLVNLGLIITLIIIWFGP